MESKNNLMYYFVQLTSYKDGSLGIDVGSTYSDLYTPKKVELMQFTGLKDKNGKEIYEGDIVTGEHFPGGVVVWNLEKARWSILCEGKHLVGLETFEINQIIGNIYENPELLNSETNDERSVATEDDSSTDDDEQKIISHE